MNILFLTMSSFSSLEEHNIYSDLMKEFIRNGHRPYIVVPVQRKTGESTQLIRNDEYTFLKVAVGNISGNVPLIEKGISTLLFGRQFYRAIIDNLNSVKMDLILYSTPPITLATPVKKLKKFFGCRTYLMLKDIFPQNAVDLKMFSKKNFIYYYFRQKEKKLYNISDKIGCMSEANVLYILKHNPQINNEKVEICPNAIKIIDKSISEEDKLIIRKKYGIPIDKQVFVYGGNLGKPQGIDFIIKCLKSRCDDPKTFFLIIGDGTDYIKLKEYSLNSKQRNFKLMQSLPREEYDLIAASCDVGLIFLDHRFTIPNFPSRLLSYMQAKIPVLACTDPNTDIGNIILEGGFGWKCDSNKIEEFGRCVDLALQADTIQLGKSGYNYLNNNYSVTKAYKIIERSLAVFENKNDNLL